jgi:hypothetical protein
MTINSPIDPLEVALVDLASRIDITDVDAFTAATMVRVQRARDDERRRRIFSIVHGSRSRQLLAVAAAILVLVSALLAIPRSRDAIADLLGVEGLRIRSGEVPTSTSVSASSIPPTSSASSSTVTTPSGVFDALAVGRDLKLGSEVSMAAARTALPALRELTTSPYGAPDAIYLASRPLNMVTFVWRARPDLPGSTNAPTVGLVVQQYPSSGDGGFFQKTLSGGARAREVVVEGKTGYWIDGEPHSIAYVDARSEFIEDTIRWATNALVWSKSGVTYRIESSLTQEQAMALVASLH